jgi:hypothetical protein
VAAKAVRGLFRIDASFIQGTTASARGVCAFERPQVCANISPTARAFLSEADSSSRKENASKQKIWSLDSDSFRADQASARHNRQLTIFLLCSRGCQAA